MEKQNRKSQREKWIVGAAIGGLAVVSLLERIDGGTAKGCDIFNSFAWVVVEVLRPVLVADWHALPGYVCENLRFLPCLLQMVAS